MIDRGKRSVLGVGVNVIDYDAAVARIVEAARLSRPLGVTALAVHGVMTGFLDPVHRYRLNHIDLVVPDGQPVRWALSFLHGERLPDRVYGPTLTLKVVEAAAREGLPVYLYGSTPAVLDALRARLLERFPGLILAGVSASRFTRVDAATNQALVEAVVASGARIVLVGLGCPRQEVFAFENAQALGCPVLAVGAAFDFHAGRLPQAPAWMQARGLEWAYRLAQEPRRLWRRYLVLNPVFLWNLARQYRRPERYSAEADPPPAGREHYA
jgi:exopolysaccharide biosynthesis WecB/TagA/CpsF family protein